MIRIGTSDLETMSILAELRPVTADQLATATGVSAEGMDRRLRQLSKPNGYVQRLIQDLGHGPGRPRNLFALTKHGAQILAEAGRLPQDRVNAVVELPKPGTHRHWIMLNTIWAELRRTQRLVPFLEAAYLASNSPLSERRPDGKSILHDQVVLDDGRLAGFEPDGAFCLRHLELKMSLLFFVEADRGTEPGKTPDERSSIRGKLECYRRYFSLAGYKRYDRTWGHPFKGFRLLILTETKRRAEAIRRWLLECPPAQFVWVAEWDALRAQGLHAPIWTVGGQTELAPQSILGGQYARIRGLIDDSSHDRTSQATTSAAEEVTDLLVSPIA